MTVGALPARRTALIGREDDIEAIFDRLDRAPVGTLTGMGGVGKTSLASEVAAEVSEGSDLKVYSVVLTAVTEASTVPRFVADAVGLPPVQGRSSLDALVGRFSGEDPVLLLLDNCE